MRRYRIGRPPAAKPQAFCDDLYNYDLGYGGNLICDYDEGGWEDIGILGPNGEAICAWSGPDPLGFLWHDEDGNLRPRHEVCQESD